jgi:predicted nuclease of predicted toxin-antitoxin system
MLRFHLDEHIDTAIADGLRRRGIDVTTTPEAVLRGAEAEAHVAFALSEGRVVVTNDADFLRLHRQGVRHD